MDLTLAPIQSSAPRTRLVIMPAYNEARSLPALLAELRREAPEYDVLVVDDGSRDGTARIAREGGAKVLVHPFNMGYGVALQTGYKFAAERGYELLVQMDGDGQHEPRWIRKLAEPILEGRADVVIGSRFLEGRGYVPPFARRVGMVVFGFLASLLTGNRVTDPTSGFQALSRRAYRYFTEDHFPFDYPDADVLILLHKARFRFSEVAVDMRPNESGQSMHSGLSPIYYVFKMLLSIAMTVLRDAPVGRSDDLSPADHSRGHSTGGAAPDLGARS